MIALPPYAGASKLIQGLLVVTLPFLLITFSPVFLGHTVQSRSKNYEAYGDADATFSGPASWPESGPVSEE